MTAIPQKAQAVTQLSFGSYRSAVGSSSRMEMYTIMPATKENMMPNARCDLCRQQQQQATGRSSRRQHVEQSAELASAGR